MNILENKRVLCLTSVFALAFAGLVYFGFGRTADGSAARVQLEGYGQQVEDHDAAALPPTRQTLSALKESVRGVNDALAALKEDFEKYRQSCVGNGETISAVDFQNRLRDSLAELGRNAQEAGCTLSPAAANLGMGAYENSAPTAEDVPYLHFQMRAARRVADLIVQSGAPLLDKVYCAPLPEAKARTRSDFFPLNLEVAFNAKRSDVAENPVSVLPQVLNSLSADKDYFIMITGMWVNSTEESLPAVDPYMAPGGDPNMGDSITDNAGGAQEPEVRQIAVRKTGSPDETVRVHLNLQVLYFNPNARRR